MVALKPHGFTLLPCEQQSDLHSIAMLRKWISRRSAYSAKRRAKELDVWNQIRRTEEEPMEMGTRGNTLLPDEYAVTKGLVSAVRTLTRTGA
jgi:hypothetical protein